MAAYFNRAVFKRNLKRFWPLAVLYFITAFLVFAAPEAGRQSASYFIGGSEREILSTLSGYCAAAVPVFSAFSAVAVFGYLHNARAASFISSLPITRLGLFITNYVSGLALTLIPNFIIGIIYGLMLIGEPVSGGQYLAWFAIMTGAHLLFYSMAVFCTFLTGNHFMQIFLYALINFIYPLIYAIAYVISQMLVYGFDGSIAFWGILSPPVAMVSELWPKYQNGDVLSALVIWGCYMLLAALLIWGGYKLYRRRAIESAGDIITLKTLRPVFKYAVSFLLGAFLGALLVALTGGFNNMAGTRLIIALFVSVSFFGALACLFIEMLLRKRLKVWKTAWKGILCYVLAVAALALFVKLDGTGFEKKIPQAQDIAAVSVKTWNQMESILLYDSNTVVGGGSYTGTYRTANNGTIKVYAGGNNWMLREDYLNRQLEQGRPLCSEEIINEIKQRNTDYFESPEAIEAVLALHRTLLEEKNELEDVRTGNSVSFCITYKMKDGTVITRRYYMPRPDDLAFASIDKMLEIYNLPEAANKRNRFLSLPEDMLIVAVAYDIDEREYYEYDVKAQGSPVDLEVSDGQSDKKAGKISIHSADELNILVQALRKDAQAETLGFLRWTDITGYQPEIKTDAQILVHLCYDSRTVPSAFESDSITADMGMQVYGYVLNLSITPDCVNTIAALRQLGLSVK